MKNLLFLIALLLAAVNFGFAQDNSGQTPVKENTETVAGGQETADEVGTEVATEGGIDWKDYVGLGALITILVGLIVYFFKKSIDVKIEEQKIAASKRLDEIEASLVKAINEKKDIVDRTFEKTDVEQKLLDTKRIFLWGEDDIKIVKRVLKNADFNLENLLSTEEDAEKGFDLLFINNEKGTLDEDEMVNKVNGLPSHVIAFYYNTSRKFFPTIKLEEGKEDKVNFVTNASQVFGNLLNSLKYQDKISRKK